MESDSGGATLQVICSDKGLQVMSSSPTESEWFTNFMTVILLLLDRPMYPERVHIVGRWCYTPHTEA